MIKRIQPILQCLLEAIEQAPNTSNNQTKTENSQRLFPTSSNAQSQGPIFNRSGLPTPKPNFPTPIPSDEHRRNIEPTDEIKTNPFKAEAAPPHAYNHRPKPPYPPPDSRQNTSCTHSPWSVSLLESDVPPSVYYSLRRPRHLEPIWLYSKSSPDR